jgi:disintegrin/metalloproteinase domain-containing protein 1
VTLPPILPDWVPWWAQLALLVLALLFAVAFLMMPFAVFGLKGRLDLLEAQLDDIHAELRMLAMRLPEAEPVRPQSRRVVVEPDEYEDEPAAVRRPVRMQDRTHPLRADNRIQPRDPPRDATRDAPRDATRDDLRDRSEPRLRWPPASERR